jgi:hypothetical protein
LQFDRIKISDYHTKFSKYKYIIIMLCHKKGTKKGDSALSRRYPLLLTLTVTDYIYSMESLVVRVCSPICRTAKYKPAGYSPVSKLTKL